MEQSRDSYPIRRIARIIVAIVVIVIVIVIVILSLYYYYCYYLLLLALFVRVPCFMLSALLHVMANSADSHGPFGCYAEGRALENRG